MSEAQFVDADAFQGGSKELTLEFVVLEHLRRITRLASVEWHGGKMVYRSNYVGSGGAGRLSKEEAFYVESTSEAYSHAVECLMDLLLCFADDKLLKAEEENNALVDEVIDRYDLFLRTGYTNKQRLEEDQKKKGDDWEPRNHSEVTQEKYKERIHREIAYFRRRLFREINLFLKRSDFFNAGGSYEEEVVA